ncbi:hypothetical protein Poli38472_005480 [Pythium oligandrum]|uniref:Thioredoxin n=1 Tax=Pythium oligandrum TaxID=41045 RepID=A0A8K1CIN5_PYTOL|nr:hypothetical protein Poli38472_005480 [Pythium oligandrum]|eukprot:TMW62862.1 hypothetical protein Poli38472_005480 [Pythium oligandrum]
MGVTEIHGEADWNTAMRNAGGKLVVVDFSATWCGPCQFIKPTYEQYSRQYHDVVFLGVDEAQNRSLIGALGVRGFPTFHFYVSQQKVDELVGADPNSLRQKIEQWRQSAFNPFASAGVTLGGSAPASAEDAREARLRRFNNLNLVPTTTPAPPAAPAAPAAPAPAEKDLSKMVCDPVTGQCSIPSEEEGKTDEMEGQEGIPPVNENFLSQMTDMGFSELRSRKALLATDSASLEVAINWLDEHQDDEDIDEPIKFVDLSKHAKKPLTEEEKAAKVAELQAKIEVRRKEREEREKQEAKEKELARRTTGQSMQEAREEYEALQRKLAADKLKKEREDFKRERERLKKQLEMDKAARRAHGGKLVGPPVDITVETSGEAQTEVKKTSPVSTLSPEEQVVFNIEKLKKYRVGGDGLTALKTLNVYVKNLIEKPDEEKFRTINLENPAFRKRVASLVGGVALLKALGYEKDEADGLLKLAVENRKDDLLQYTRTSLERAITELS